MPDGRWLMAVRRWPMADGGSPLADGRWQMADGRWQMADGRWQMADGRWRMADGRWQMADGRWQMADGRWQRQGVHSVRESLEPPGFATCGEPSSRTLPSAQRPAPCLLHGVLNNADQIGHAQTDDTDRFDPAPR